MSKFNKKKKDMPGVNTASLPDIVFMLLFFFMVTTVMKDTDLLIKQTIPKASEIKMLQQKKLVSYIYVGKDKNGGNKDIIQLNDKISSVNDIQKFILERRTKVSQNELNRLTTSIKADVNNKVGTIYDIKKELREVEALKINYSVNKGARIKTD